MHKKFEALLTAYTDEIVAHRLAADQRFLIYSVQRHPVLSPSPFVGGLSDRLRGLVAAFYMAVATKRRFVIHWNSPRTLQDNLAPGEYDWTYETARRFWKDSKSIKHVDLIDRSEILDRLHPKSLDAMLIGRDQVVVMNINHFRVNTVRTWLEEEFSELPSYGLVFATAFNFLFSFVPKPEFQASRDRCAAARASSDALLGVHLRTGSGNGWRDPVLDDWQNYPLVLERAFEQAKTMGASDPAFYFFSDSLEARKAVAGASWPHPVITDLEQPAHMDRSDAADSYAHDLTFHEFQMLSETDAIVCGKGGFGPLAAMVNGKKLIRYDVPETG